MRGVVFVAFALLGCGQKQPGSPDAEAPADLLVDTPIDTAVLPPDVTPDAPPPSLCTAFTTLIDVSPRRLANIARSGPTLYASAFAFDGVTASDPVVLSIDLTTRIVDPTPLATASVSVLSAAGDDVYAIETGGTITRLRPGEQPQVVITNRLNPRAATADGGFLYWTEENPASGQDLVRRRLIAGGPIEEVMSCENPFRLLVVGADLYCAGRVLEHAPKAGGGPTTRVGNSDTGFFIPTIVEDGGMIYFGNSEANHPTLFEVEPPNPATKIHQQVMFGRYSGLAVSPTFVYAIADETGLWRFDRTTHLAEQLVSTTLLNQEPVRFNGELYVQSATATSSGTPLVVHCLE